MQLTAHKDPGLPHTLFLKLFDAHDRDAQTKSMQSVAWVRAALPAEPLLEAALPSLPVNLVPLILGNCLLRRRCQMSENTEALTSFALVLIEDLPQLLLLLPGLCLTVRGLHGHLREERALSAPGDLKHCATGMEHLCNRLLQHFWKPSGLTRT